MLPQPVTRIKSRLIESSPIEKHHAEDVRDIILTRHKVTVRKFFLMEFMLD